MASASPAGAAAALLFVMLSAIASVAPAPSPAPAPSRQPSCKAWLVQSIPTDMPDLKLVPGVLSTGDVLQWISGNATRNMDILAQYWELLPQQNNSLSGDYGYSEAEMKKFGADQGISVFKALDEAAGRKVDIRIVQHSGFAPEYNAESSKIAAGRANVHNKTLLLGDWSESGIIHSKVWIADKKDMYIGSANNDWKSFTQVKEVGIYFAGCPTIVSYVEKFFENLYTLTTLNATLNTKVVWDEQWQVKRKVPCWSHFISKAERCSSPLPSSIETPHVAGYPELSDAYMFDAPFQTPGIKVKADGNYLSYLSFSPPEMLFGGSASDEQGWVDTIKSVNVGGIVRMNTMDWNGQSQYFKPTIFWPSLLTAISEVVFTKNATVRVIVAYWAHNLDNTDVHLKNLLYTNVLCKSSKYNTCGGKVEIMYYQVPGFNMTGPAKFANGTATGNLYPDFSRVNHAKYAVSDARANIGTSNLIWDYFYATSGVSFGTYNPAIVSQLQEIFDADWNSPYVVPVKPLASS